MSLFPYYYWPQYNIFCVNNISNQHVLIVKYASFKTSKVMPTGTPLPLTITGYICSKLVSWHIINIVRFLVAIYTSFHKKFIKGLKIDSICHAQQQAWEHWASFGFMMTSSNGNIFRVTGLCAGNSPVTGGFHALKPVTRSSNAFFDLRLN